MVGGRFLSLGSVAVLASLSIGMGAWSATTSSNTRGTSRPAATTSPGKVTDYLMVPGHFVSGPYIRAILVVNNPGGTLNITNGCAPTLLVNLMKSLPEGPPPRPHECFGGAYILHRGVTRISGTLNTTYNGCSDGGNVLTTMPPCDAGIDPIPPLPPGRYFAVATWNWPVKYLPAAPPVSVVVTDH